MSYLLYFPMKAVPLAFSFLLNFCLVAYAQQRSQSDAIKCKCDYVSCSKLSDVSSSHSEWKSKPFLCSTHPVISVSPLPFKPCLFQLCPWPFLLLPCRPPSTLNMPGILPHQCLCLNVSSALSTLPPSASKACSIISKFLLKWHVL